jgi:hypothetical protein
MVMAEGDRRVMENLQRKAASADQMFENLVAEMNNAAGIGRVNLTINDQEVPKWL